MATGMNSQTIASSPENAAETTAAIARTTNPMTPYRAALLPSDLRISCIGLHNKHAMRTYHVFLYGRGLFAVVLTITKSW